MMNCGVGQMCYKESYYGFKTGDRIKSLVRAKVYDSDLRRIEAGQTGVIKAFPPKVVSNGRGYQYFVYIEWDNGERGSMEVNAICLTEE